MMRKKPFLLLEVLIALTLLAFFSSYIIKEPIFLFRKQLNARVELECERIFTNTMVEIKEKLYRNEISWEDLQISLKPVLLNLPLQKRTITRNCAFKVVAEKNKDSHIYRELKVTLTLQSGSTTKQFSQIFFVQKTL